MADYGNDYWAIAVNLLTGYPMPPRATVFDDVTGEGKVPMLNVTIEDRKWSGTIPDAGTGGEDVDGHDFVIPFFIAGADGASEKKPILRRAVFDFVTAGPKLAYGDAYWSDETKQALDGKALGQYIGGSLDALQAIAFAPYSSVGLKLSGAAVVDAAAVDMNTFYRAAGAFDRVGKFFVDHAATVKQWQDSLGKDDAAWKGKAAGVFKDLIDTLQKNYQSYADQMHPSGFTGANTWQPHFYTSTTKQGDALIGAGNAVLDEAQHLLSTGKKWASGANGTYAAMSEDGAQSHLVGIGNPYGIVQSLLREVLFWVMKHNWPEVQVTTKTTYVSGYNGTGVPVKETEYGTTANFKENFPGFGNLNAMSTWQALGKDAVKAWNDAVDSQLVPAAKASLSNINNAWISAQHVMETVVETKSTSALGSSSDPNGDGNDGLNTDSYIQQLQDQAQKAIDDANKAAQDAIDKANAAAQAAQDKAEKQAQDEIDKMQAEMTKQQEDDQNQLKQAQEQANQQIDDANKQAQAQSQAQNDQLQQQLTQTQQGTGNLSTTGSDGLDANGGTSLTGDGGTNLSTNSGSGDVSTTGGTPVTGDSGLGTDAATSLTGESGTSLSTSAGSGDLSTSGGDPLTGDGGVAGSPIGSMSSSVTNTGGGSISTGGGLGGGQSGAGTITSSDGSITQTNPDGTKVTTAPDGTVTRVDPDGTTTVTLPDGTVQTQNPDGTVTTHTGGGTVTTNNPSSAGGGVSTKYPDGTSTTANPDGTTTVTESDGTTTTTDPGTGQVSTHFPDGTSSVTAPDGTITTTHPDGSTSVSHPDGNTSVTGPDGTVTTADGHGTTTVRYPDGTSLTSSPDGSTKITGPDGTVTTSDGAGTITTANPDGSTTVTHPDGTISTTGPTASTVTDPGSGTTTGTGLGSGSGLGTTDGRSGLGSGLGTGSDLGSGLTTDPGTGHVSTGLGGSSAPSGSASVPSAADLSGGASGAGHSGDGYAYDETSAGGGDLTGDNPFTASEAAQQSAGSGMPIGGMGGMGGTGGGAGGGQGGNERVRNSGARGSIGTPGRGNRPRRRAAEEELYEEEEAAFTPGMTYGTAPGAGTRPERTATESGDRERSAWVQEDEDVWGTEEGTTPAVIGR